MFDATTPARGSPKIKFPHTRTAIASPVTGGAEKAFKNYPRPGNIRELENLMERDCILETANVLKPEL